MIRFLLQRLGLSLVTLFLLSVIVFATAQLLPGDVGRNILGGVVAALKQGHFADRTITITGLSLTAVPEFVTAIVLIIIFGVVLGWLPVTATAPPGAGFLTQAKFLLLPALALVMVLFGYIARIARARSEEHTSELQSLAYLVCRL